MINIADSRFQGELLAAAKRAHKIGADHQVPEIHRHNTPERLDAAFAAQRRAGLFSEYPFGTDLTREEIDLARALRWLKENTATPRSKLGTLLRAWTSGGEADHRYLDRLGLAQPRDFREKLTVRLVSLGLNATSRTGVPDP
jgi:hypothetical protein